MIRRSIRYAGLHAAIFLLLTALLLFYIGPATAAVAPQPGDFRGCPEQGQGGDPDLNRLKNRADRVSTPESMTVAQINALVMPLEALRGRRASWPASTRQEISALEQQGVVVEAVLIGVKQEGPETRIVGARICTTTIYGWWMHVSKRALNPSWWS